MEFTPKNNIITLAAHNGSFHTDDVFAIATWLLYLEKKVPGTPVQVMRTRHPAEIAEADVVVDVGGEYDSTRFRFDHHQRGGAGVRENTIPYASFGLVWKHIGPYLCGNDAELWEKIDTSLVCAIDAYDNGKDVAKMLVEGVNVPTLPLFMMIEKPTWQERGSETAMFEAFMRAVTKAKAFLDRYMIVQQARIKALREIVATYNESANPAIVVFPHDYERINFVDILPSLPGIFFYIYPDNSGTWSAEAVSTTTGTFEKRKPFPVAWAGLHDEELQKVSGVEDALFCHNGLFMVKAQTEAGAVNLAKIALMS